jgi:carbonyl reductase 1
MQVVITGANKGVGLATVRAMLGRPDTFVWLGSRSPERGDAARRSLLQDQPAWSDRLRTLTIDVSEQDSVCSAARTVSAELGSERLHGLVNNAGIGLGTEDMAAVLNVNTLGPKRVFEHFLPLLDPHGRVVNVSSASGPNFVASCSPEVQSLLTDPGVTWASIDALLRRALDLHGAGGDFRAAGLGDGSAYGLSKAALNALTIVLARTHRSLKINACTPGFIETDLTRPYADQSGMSPEQMGMKPPSEGTRAAMHLLFEDVVGSGWYFGSDAQRSPLDRYRSPGDPPFQGD